MITVNGIEQELVGSVAELVAAVTREQRGVAVAINGEVVPRGEWGTCPLADGDTVEILTAAQGG
ncbi:MAG: sulfur carrier protein ThiS [Hamadaea sp.]|uniref:sulfur carrier protein ThiS n=1 Tax=Hamadaea sp. TaxID=2024425 RepID=UPI0017F0BFCC|nr:sulfur carrier protein ThiS [Hamadaea sp.]NUR69860.1 sulfur carrier protein ThiS [Hamadaea sp.]NUT20105.1 sulfur carrier protein ThiS [Hamadaea sp.]